MGNFRTNSESQKLNAFNDFRNKHEDENGGLETKELAAEFAKLKLDWWGSNLVFLGIEEKAGKFYPSFNVFD